MGGLTWVSTAATHRRQGVLSQLMARTLADIDRRGEPVAMLGASEGGIYERYGFGVATQVRVDGDRSPAGAVATRVPTAARHACGSSRATRRWRTWRTYGSGSIGFAPARSIAARRGIDSSCELRAEPQGGISPSFYLAHRDGYAVYRIEEQWNDGRPAHNLRVIELVAVNGDAHAALWHTLLGVDLVGVISSRQSPIDDPLPYLLTDPRALQTTALNDGIWVNVRDVATCMAARTYGTDDRLVIEVDSERWVINGGPKGATCARVRSKPDLITDIASLGALLLGGVRPSALAAGRRLEARNSEALRRGDAFFLTSPAPHCQTPY